MPLLAASKKALRVSKRKTAQNIKTATKLQRITKKVMKLIKLGERALAEQQLSEAYKAIDKAAKKGFLRPNKSARMKSQLAKAVSQQEASPIKESSPKKEKTPAKKTKKTAANVKTSSKNS